MAEKIQIDAGQDQSITALHSAPEESLTSRIDQTLVIMSHGFPGHKAYQDDLYGAVEFLLADRGYHTLRFDYRGCGESDGREENFTIGSACEDFQAVLYWAKSKGYKRFIYLGEGLGATLAIMNMDLDVRALIMFWPVFDLKSYAGRGLNVKEISDQEQKQGYVDNNNRRIGLNLINELKKIDIMYALKEVFVPTVIFHGARDALVPISQLDIGRRYIPAKRIEITTFHDGVHGMAQENHRKAMMYQILQFVEKYI